MKRAGDYTLHFKDQKFLLLPEKALFWEEENALLLSDLHLGKAGHFRKAGIPVAKDVNMKNLIRLQDLISHFSPEKIFILGDLFHSDRNKEWDDFAIWRSIFPEIDFYLILGNHDFLSVPEYERLGLICYNELQKGPFLLVHDPVNQTEKRNKYLIGGHIHPSVSIKGKGRQSLRFPCFYFGEGYGLLPAFGDFTGTHPVKPSKTDLFFPIVDKQILKF